MFNSTASSLYDFFMSYSVFLGYFFMIVFSMIAVFILFVFNYEFSKTVYNKMKNALENHKLYRGIKSELENQNEWKEENIK